MFSIEVLPEIRPFKIGNVKISNPLVLAPMAGITDPVFRGIAKSLGAGLVYTEMISCQAIHYNNQKTWKLAEINPDEVPVAAQIFGAEPDLMAQAARLLEERGFSIIDINLGCSVPKVAKAGAGATLCRNLDLVKRVMDSVVHAVKIPTTIKIRLGWSQKEITAPEIIRIAKETGISAVAIHGRTSSQGYSGKADWDSIGKLASWTDLPVIGNGDIKDPGAAAALLDGTRCSGIMIGREALSNPWIFRDALCLLQGKEIPEKPPPYQVKELILYHLKKLVERWGEGPGVEKMRKFISWYSRGLRGAARFREAIFLETTLKGVVGAIDGYFKFLESYSGSRQVFESEGLKTFATPLEGLKTFATGGGDTEDGDAKDGAAKDGESGGWIE